MGFSGAPKQALKSSVVVRRSSVTEAPVRPLPVWACGVAVPAATGRLFDGSCNVNASGVAASVGRFPQTVTVALLAPVGGDSPTKPLATVMSKVPAYMRTRSAFTKLFGSVMQTCKAGSPDVPLSYCAVVLRLYAVGFAPPFP